MALQAKRENVAGQRTYTAGADINAGTVVNVGTADHPIAGVVMTDLLDGQQGVAETLGEFKCAAKDSEAIALGDAVGWDDSADVALKYTDAAADWYLGIATEAQDGTNNLVKVDLNANVGITTLNADALPTSDPSINGALYVDTGVVKVS